MEEQGYRGAEKEVWDMAVRSEKILCTALDEAYEQQGEETMETLSKGQKTFTIVTWTEDRDPLWGFGSFVWTSRVLATYPTVAFGKR
jgi:hypothetical protein